MKTTPKQLTKRVASRMKSLTLAERLGRLRRKAALTDHQFAQTLGMSEHAVFQQEAKQPARGQGLGDRPKGNGGIRNRLPHGWKKVELTFSHGAKGKLGKIRHRQKNDQFDPGLSVVMGTTQ